MIGTLCLYVKDYDSVDIARIAKQPVCDVYGQCVGEEPQLPINFHVYGRFANCEVRNGRIYNTVGALLPVNDRKVIMHVLCSREEHVLHPNRIVNSFDVTTQPKKMLCIRVRQYEGCVWARPDNVKVDITNLTAKVPRNVYKDEVFENETTGTCSVFENVQPLGYVRVTYENCYEPRDSCRIFKPFYSSEVRIDITPKRENFFLDPEPAPLAIPFTDAEFVPPSVFTEEDTEPTIVPLHRNLHENFVATLAPPPSLRKDDDSSYEELREIRR